MCIIFLLVLPIINVVFIKANEIDYEAADIITDKSVLTIVNPWTDYQYDSVFDYPRIIDQTFIGDHLKNIKRYHEFLSSNQLRLQLRSYEQEMLSAIDDINNLRQMAYIKKDQPKFLELSKLLNSAIFLTDYIIDEELLTQKYFTQDIRFIIIHLKTILDYVDKYADNPYPISHRFLVNLNAKLLLLPKLAYSPDLLDQLSAIGVISGGSAIILKASLAYSFLAVIATGTIGFKTPIISYEVYANLRKDAMMERLQNYLLKM